MDIRKPVTIKLETTYPKKKKFRGYLGWHMPYSIGGSGKVDIHEIVVYLPALEDDNSSMKAIIAHELIHAWQAEKYPKLKKFHGSKFQLMAGFIESAFDLKQVFRPGFDLN
jgi:hypothetical protein